MFLNRNVWATYQILKHDFNLLKISDCSLFSINVIKFSQKSKINKQTNKNAKLEEVIIIEQPCLPYVLPYVNSLCVVPCLFMYNIALICVYIQLRSKWYSIYVSCGRKNLNSLMLPLHVLVSFKQLETGPQQRPFIFTKASLTGIKYSHLHVYPDFNGICISATIVLRNVII